MGRAGARQCLVRSQCRSCGIQHRIDAAVQALRFGASASPVDRLDRCAVVGCQGAAFYMVVRTYGRQWIVMVSGDDPRVSIAPAASAVSLDLLDPTISKAVIYIYGLYALPAAKWRMMHAQTIAFEKRYNIICISIR